VHLAQQQILMLYRPFSIRNVTSNFGRADDLAGAVADRRNGQGDVDKTAILTSADRLE